MKDIYGAFANAALENYSQKIEPKKIFSLGQKSDQESNSQDTQSNSSFASSMSSSFGNIKDKLFSNSTSQQPPVQQQQQQQSSRPIQFIVGKMNDRADYTKAFICFAISALFLLFAVFSLPMIVISPQKFTSLFSIAAIALIFGLAFMNGPATYVKKLTERKNLIATWTLILSIIFSLYFSIIEGSYLWSILFCFLEFNSVLLFFCNTFPAGSAGIRLFGSTARGMLSASLSSRT